MPKEEEIVLTDEEVKAGHCIRDGKKVYDPLERFQSDEQESLVEKGEEIFLTDEEIKAGFYIKDGKRVICPLVPFQSEKAVDGNNDIGDLEDASRINESEPCKNVEDECRESPSAYNTSEACKGRAPSDNKQPNLDVRTESVQYEIPYQNRVGQLVRLMRSVVKVFVVLSQLPGSLKEVVYLRI